MLQTENYKRPHDVVIAAAEALLPTTEEPPCEVAARTLKTEKGDWNPNLVPYCHEPLNYLAGREYRGIVFVGPARTGKTMGLILGGISYIITTSPADAIVIQMSKDAARDFSRMDLDRAIRHSPELARRLSPRARDDNTFDKYFRSGVALKLGWPAVSQLSSKTFKYVFLTDYDRPPNAHNVDGEGPMWDLAQKRTETYMSRGKCLAESSPGEEQTDASWRARSPHEAPPTRGILSLYNDGTRARWYWRCQHKQCGEHFQAAPGLGCFAMPGFDELVEAVQTHDLMTLADGWAKVVCPHCGGLHEPAHRPDMNRPNNVDGRIQGATWLHEGETIVDGRIEGERRRSQIVSYWLGGVSAAYQTWPSIVHRYLQAVLKYARTGDEEPLKTTTNTDQGAVYLPRSVKMRRSAEDLVQRQEDWPRGTIPDGVRFLTAAVDVQLNAFVVTFFGWGVGLESWLVDRFRISASKRPEGERFAGVEPAAYDEDWELLLPEVVDKVYKTASGIEMKARLTLCDSGGKAGVTNRAYEFWRLMKRRGKGDKFRLVKGSSNANAPRVHKTFPDARKRKDSRSGGRGDVPVWMLNVNILKDGIIGDLAREAPGPGYVHLPVWIDGAFFDEMMAETRTPKGWVREGSAPNEAFDLHVYNRAAVIVLRAENIDWSRPPIWAVEPDRREDLMHAQDKAVASQPKPASYVNRGTGSNRRKGYIRR